MSNYYHNLDELQAKHFASLKAGDKMVLVVPLPKQPPEGSTCYHTDEEYAFFCDDNAPYETCNRGEIELPYPPNARVGFRETWGICLQASPHSYNKYLYKVDNYCGGICLFTCYTKWHSSQSMPIEAIQDWGKVTATRVDRVQGVTVSEIAFTGIMSADPETKGSLTDEFKDWFNARYSKPRPRVEKGAIISYECCIYSWHDVHYGITKDYRYRFYGNKRYEWKGKPLKIIVDPVCAITKMKKE